jgi:hypothetical protein
MFGFLQEREEQNQDDLEKICECCCHKDVHECDPETWDCEHCQQPGQLPSWEKVFDRTFLVLPLKLKVGQAMSPNVAAKKFIRLHQMDMAKKFMDKIEERFSKYQDGTLWDAESFLNELDQVLDEMEANENPH